MKKKKSSSLKLPITIIHGFQGAGKSAHLSYMVASLKDCKIFFLFPPLSLPSMIDGFKRHQTNISVSSKNLTLTLKNGSVGRVLEDDWVKQIQQMVSQNLGFDALYLECPWDWDPFITASIFLSDEAKGHNLSESVYIDAMVTVVNAQNFIEDYTCSEDIAIVDHQGKEEQHNISDILVEQVEFSDVVLINRVDTLAKPSLKARKAVKGLLRALNLKALLLSSRHGVVDSAKFFNQKRFHFETTLRSPGWVSPHRISKMKLLIETGIKALVFEERIPFHPVRLWDFLHAQTIETLRVHGVMCIASRAEHACVWSQAGSVMHFESEGLWQDSEDAKGGMQRVVFIHQFLSDQAILEPLRKCLLTDKELAQGPDLWKTYEPLGLWDLMDTHHHDH